MSESWWGDAKELAGRVFNLTANVNALQDRVARNERTIEELKDIIRELRADLRVARAEIKGEAQQVAMGAVIAAHEQILTRVIRLEGQPQPGAALAAPRLTDPAG